MKIYLVKLGSYEFDGVNYSHPYVIYYSLDRDKARQYFEKLVNDEIKSLKTLLKKHHEFENSEDYQIVKNEENYFEISFGKWCYEYIFDEVELEKDLRYVGGI